MESVKPKEVNLSVGLYLTVTSEARQSIPAEEKDYRGLIAICAAGLAATYTFPQSKSRIRWIVLTCVGRWLRRFVVIPAVVGGVSAYFYPKATQQVQNLTPPTLAHASRLFLSLEPISVPL